MQSGTDIGIYIMHVTQFCHKQYSFETLSLLWRQKVPNSFAYYRLAVCDYAGVRTKKSSGSDIRTLNSLVQVSYQ